MVVGFNLHESGKRDRKRERERERKGERDWPRKKTEKNDGVDMRTKIF